KIIVDRPGQTFQMVAQVVAEQAGRASLKRRQTRLTVYVISSQAFLEHRKRIGLARGGLDPRRPHRSSPRLEPVERIGSDEGVSSQSRMAAGAVEKQQMGQPCQTATYVPGIRRRRQFRHHTRGWPSLLLLR